MNFADLLTLIDSNLQESLTKGGFSHAAAGLWRCRNREDVSVLWLQEHSARASFCVNLGIHYAFLPKVGTEAPLVGDEIEQPECEIRLRLTIDPAHKDYWWPISEQSVADVCQLIKTKGFAIYDTYRLDGAVMKMEGNDIEAGNLGLLSGLTKVRTLLFLARLHEHFGNREKCVDAATRGIKLAGMAVGPKKALKDILQRCE